MEQEAAGRTSWQENDLVFPSSIGTPFAKTDVERDYHAILARVGLRRIRFHDLRHTAASLMLNHGIPPLVVSRILGHANSSVTLTIYAHSSLEMQAGAAALMDELVTPMAVDMRDLQLSATNLQPESIKARL